MVIEPDFILPTNDQNRGEKSENPLLQIIQDADKSMPVAERHWKYSDDPEHLWISCKYDDRILLEQGWKLHLSARVTSAEIVLKRVLPILLAVRATFKLTSSLAHLYTLNTGRFSRSQIGKFITIYPMDDDEAVQLAVRLDDATKDLEDQHVAIPSDRPLRQGSLVYYRYGQIRSHSYLQDELGGIYPAIQAPNGDFVPDPRQTYYEPPAWVRDPFIAAGIAGELAPTTHIIKDRYLIISTIAEGNHRIYLGVDLEMATSCVIKGQGLPVFSVQDNLLHHEAQIMRRLKNNPHVPKLLDEVEQDGNLFLIIEDIAGETLLDRIYKQERSEHVLTQQQLIAWGIEIAQILSTIHAENLVYSDLKPANIIIGTQGKLYLIDFDSTREQDDLDSLLIGRGTPGFRSPQQQSSQQATVSDDIYALGSLLYFMVTAVDEGQMANDKDHHIIFNKPLELLRPDINPALSAIIQRCLQEQREDRYDSISELIKDLAAVPNHVAQLSISLESKAVSDDYALAQERYKTLSNQLLKTLCTVAEKAENSDGMYWRSTHNPSYKLPLRDIAKGNAGTLLAMAELVSKLGTAEAMHTFTEAAHWLQNSQPVNQQPLPGLYIGEAGVGAALLRAGQVLHDKTLIEAAIVQSRKVAALPFKLIDIYNGAAGRLRFHLLLWNETREPEHLQTAIACAEYLLSIIQENSDHETYWSTPEGYGKFSQQSYVGYAHGAAGIADALLDLFEVTGDERLLAVVQSTAQWIAHQSFPSLADGSGLNWPVTFEGTVIKPAFWCHGATGIGRFFMHAAICDIYPAARTLAQRAAKSTAQGTRTSSPTQCHGLSGNIEFLIDMYQFTGDVTYKADAFSLGKILETFSTEKDGYLAFPSEVLTTFTPDYSLGYAGVATSFLRLSDPEHLPYLLSRAGFEQRA